MYNYLSSMKEDVCLEIKGIIDWDGLTLEDFQSRRDELEEQFYEQLWINDVVTGNASGSYTCNSSRAEEYVKDNFELLKEAFEIFGYNSYEEIGKVVVDGSWEYADVTIRCYLLGQVIADVLDYMEEADSIEELEELENIA